MAKESNYADKSYHEKVSQQVELSTGKQIEGIKTNIENAQITSNNSNLSSSTKNTSLALNAVDTSIKVLGVITGAVNDLIGSALMPMIEGLGIKGIACLPISKQLDPVLGIDVHMVTIPPSPAPVPMPHPYIGVLLKPEDFLAAKLASVLSENFVPKEPENIENPSEAQQQSINEAKGKQVLHTVLTMAISSLGATVKIGSFIPRAVAGTPTKSIPHFAMGAGFYAPVDAVIQKNIGHALMGSLVVLADGDPISGGGVHLHNNCWDIGIPSFHDNKKSKNKLKSAPKKSVFKAQLYLPSGIIIPIPPKGQILTNPIPSPYNAVDITKKLLKATLGKIFAKKTIPKGKKKENNPNETLPPGTKRNAAGRLIDSKTGKFVKDPNKKNRGSANSNKKNRKAQQLKKNNTNGKKRESEVKNELLAEGHEVIGSQVSVKTDHTRRVVDHLIIDKDTKELVAVEVKSGNATRNATQILKDDSMASKGGKIIGKNAPEKLLNKTKTIKTIIRN